MFIFKRMTLFTDKMADTEPKKRSADDDKEGNGESAENGTKKRRTSGGDVSSMTFFCVC